MSTGNTCVYFYAYTFMLHTIMLHVLCFILLYFILRATSIVHCIHIVRLFHSINILCPLMSSTVLVLPLTSHSPHLTSHLPSPLMSPIKSRLSPFLHVSSIRHVIVCTTNRVKFPKLKSKPKTKNPLTFSRCALVHSSLILT